MRIPYVREVAAYDIFTMPARIVCSLSYPFQGIITTQVEVKPCH